MEISKFDNNQVQKVSDFLQSYMTDHNIEAMTADKCAEIITRNGLLEQIPPKPGFNFRQMLRDGRDGKIELVSGAEQLRPNTEWKIRRIKNRLECLINPSEEESLNREPLLAFSFYLNSCNNMLFSVKDEIIEELDIMFENPDSIIVDGHVSTQMWLWTLGAYEVVRTMCQAKICFSDSFFTKIVQLKKKLSVVRMPSAKMERQGKKEPILSTRSHDGWDIKNKDILIGDPENPISARSLLNDYEETIRALKPTDILNRHEESYL